MPRYAMGVTQWLHWRISRREPKPRGFCPIFGPKKCMLEWQTVQLIGKYGKLAKFTARCLLHCSEILEARSSANGAVCTSPLTAFRHDLTIHLESAAFVFHINHTTQGITGSLRAACSEPVQRFLACPFS